MSEKTEKDYMRLERFTYFWALTAILFVAGCRTTDIPEEPDPNVWVCCYQDALFYAEEEFVKPTSVDGIEFSCTDNLGTFIRTQCDLSGGYHSNQRCEINGQRFRYYKETVDPTSYTAAEAETDCNGKDWDWKSF
jgi:hypothetical protein